MIYTLYSLQKSKLLGDRSRSSLRNLIIRDVLGDNLLKAKKIKGERGMEEWSIQDKNLLTYLEKNNGKITQK